MKFDINWIKTKSGNGFVQNDVLIINAKGASHISGAIYQNNLPILAIFGLGERVKIKLAVKRKNIKGVAILKLRAFDKQNRGFGINDAFIII